MQLKKLSPLAGLILTGLLSACGGGGGDAPPPAAPPPPPAITVSALSLNSATPNTIAESANPLQFDGGVCSGGTGTLTAAWDFGDSTTVGSYAPHNYLDSAAGTRTVTVTCTDTAGTTPGTATLRLTVLPAAMNGFLGKSWTTYAQLDPTNQTPYPVAGIAATTGDVLGVWIRRYDNHANNEVVTGKTTFGLTSWDVPAVLPSSGPLPYIDSTKSMLTTAIDISVSSDGYAMAAWMAGTTVWYATKIPTSGAWSAPASIPSSVGVTNTSIKVVVNNSGNGAIAYCTGTGAYAIPYLSNTLVGSPQKISNKCDKVDTDVTGTPTLQRSRAFDIAINSSSKIFAAGILDATSGAPKSAVVLQSYTAAWTSEPFFADEIAASSAPESLSLSLSPNGTYAALAWNQVDASTHSNVYFSMLNGSVWSPAASFSHDITPTTDYSRAQIAINDSGDAVLAMRLTNSFSVMSVAVANYDASAATPAWSKEQIIASSSGYRALDIAIDNWGTALVTNVDESINYTQAGTFAKKPGATQWSGFKKISSSAPDTVFYLGSIHYQTMRALPDGRAVLVTSVYDDRTINLRIPSGYMLLK